MKTLTVQELEADFDFVIEQVEKGHCYLITHQDKKCVLMPVEEYTDNIDILCDHNDAC